MENTTAYLHEYGKYTFAEHPFSEVDSLIMCQLSYLKFAALAPGFERNKAAASFRFMKRREQFDSLFVKEWFEEEYREFYEAIYRSKRFRHLKVSYYVDIVKEELEMQFAAMTFFMEDGLTYIAFRGTDESLVGWKEDFNMAFLSPIPAQEAALYYLKEVAGRVPGKLIIGGHSKGGNAAIYAAMESEADIRKRIWRVYCFDGPGFREDIYQREGYLDIQKRIVKIVPEASFVGMLLQNKSNYSIVESDGKGALQHDPFTWRVSAGQFVYKKEIFRTSIYGNKSLNSWIEKLSKEALQVFVDTLFEIIYGTKAATVMELTESRHKSILAMMSAAKNLDRDTKKFMLQVIALLFKNGKKKQPGDLHTPL